MEKVAIKIISKAYLQSSEILTRATKREMALLQLIRHRNIVRYIDAIDEPHIPYVYIIMEYIEGCELFDHLLESKRLKEAEARNIFWQVCVAVDWCHQRNICHRDLKPENILLSGSKNEVKIVDFGMASLQPQTSLLKTSCGSPHYACPEIVTGKQYDGRLADVWSCGVILFALLSGRLPFEDSNLRVLLQRIKSGQYVMSTYFSADARNLIKSMLETDPKRRIQMDDVIRHPWFMKETNYTLPANIPELPCQYSQSVELERNTLNIMKTLLDCNRSSTILSAICSNRPNMEQMLLSMLKQSAKTNVIGEPMTISKQALLECLDFKSPASALSSSSTLCDNTPNINKAFDVADKIVHSHSGTIEGDGHTISHCSHDISSASKPDGVSLIAKENLNEEIRNCPMIHQFGLMAGCLKSRPAQAKLSYASPQPVIAVDTIYDIQRWKSDQRRKERTSTGKRVSGWMRLSFWKQPKEKYNQCIIECSGQDEDEAVSKVVYTITNLMQGSFTYTDETQTNSIGKGQVQAFNKHIPVFVMFCLHAIRVQPLSANRRTVTLALSPINTDLNVLTEAGNDIQRLLQQYDLDEAETLTANGWTA
ncbi:hypothetical protein NQZ79_g7807 [Umbelopsis isabellina]|nr:hypothetical protein NQZ79_g7807 [Umbelopsis isabellina]